MNENNLEKNVKNKIQNLKAKLMVQKMQHNMEAMNKEGKTNLEMNNPKNPKKEKKEKNKQNNSMELETNATESNVVQRNDGCWRKFLDCFGLAEMPENERFIKQ